MIPAMGAWGTGVFDDDLTCDIRGDYREMVENRVADVEAETAIVEQYGGTDEQDLVWLALAVAESDVGRLSDDVRTQALEAIDSGRLIETWIDLGGADVDERRHVLDQAREQLAGDQPRRTTIEKAWRSTTGLRPGQILTISDDRGLMTAFLVGHVDQHETGAAPWLVSWDWVGTSLPESEALKETPFRQHYFGYRATGHPQWTRPARNTESTPDWSDVGFVLTERFLPIPDGVVPDMPQILDDWNGVARRARQKIEEHQA